MSHKLKGAEEKIATAEKVLAAEERISIATKRIEQAVEEPVNGAIKKYVQSKAFDDKLHETGVESYNLGLADCLKKVKKFYPNLDTSKIEENSDEEDSDEEKSDEENQTRGPITDQTERLIKDQTEKLIRDQLEELVLASQIPEKILPVPSVSQSEIHESSIEVNVTN